MMEERKNAVIYARFSSDNQREESIEGQLRECKAFAEKNGYLIVGTYIDRAYSARTADRPDFQNMIKDSANKTFDYVIVWKLDRFSRDRIDSAMYKSVLKKNKVKVVSATENITDDPTGILMEAVLEGMSEYYSADLSEKVIRGLTENALKCKFNGGTIPIGYKVNGSQYFEVDPLTAPAVVEAFESYANGATMRQVADELNAKGVKNNVGGMVTENTVARMLHNRKYIGEYKFRDIITPNGIPAIVTEELFERVQSRMEINKKAPAKHKAEDEYILSGKLFCGKCERMMTGESGTSHTLDVHRYYKCYGVRKHLCDKKTVKKDYIENLVIKHIQSIMFDDKLIDRLADDVLEELNKENTVIPVLRKQYSETAKGIENIINAIQLGILTPSTKQRLEELERAKTELSMQIAKEEMKKPALTKAMVVEWFTKLRKFDITKTEHRRRLVDAFINAVFLYDDRIVIVFNYKNSAKTTSLEDVHASPIGSDLTTGTAPNKNRNSDTKGLRFLLFL